MEGGSEVGHSGHFNDSECLLVCIHMFLGPMCVHLPCTDVVYVYFMCVSVALKSMHPREFEKPGRSVVEAGLSFILRFCALTCKTQHCSLTSYYQSDVWI